MTGTGLFSWDAGCYACGHRWEMLTPKEDANWDWRTDCPVCGRLDTVGRVMSAPRVLKASWPDGHKRSDLAGLKEAAKLELALESTDSEAREKELKSMAKWRARKDGD